MDERLAKLGSRIRRIEVQSTKSGLRVVLYFKDVNGKLQRYTGDGATYEEALAVALDNTEA